MTDQDNPSSDQVATQLTFGEHLDELRVRLIISLIALFVAFLVCFHFSEGLMAFVLEPMIDTLSELGYTSQVVYTKAQEKFIAYLKLSAVAALFVSSPVIMYQAWAFVAAGLYRSERRYVVSFAPASFLSFISGVLFFYFMMMPWGLQFLLAFGGDDTITPMIQVSEHISFFLMLSLIMGLVFQLPLVMLFITKIRVLTWEQFAEKRRFAILFGFVLAAILTPPDVFTQIMLALPFCFLYEIGIMVSRIGMVEQGVGDEGGRVNLRGLMLLLLPTFLIAGLVAVKLISFPARLYKEAGRRLDDETFVMVMGQFERVPGEAWEQMLGSTSGKTRLRGLWRLAASKSPRKADRMRHHMQHDADPALQIVAAGLLFETGAKHEAGERLIALLENAAAPQYAYLAHLMLKRVSKKPELNQLPPVPDKKAVAETASFWTNWLATLK